MTFGGASLAVLGIEGDYYRLVGKSRKDRTTVPFIFVVSQEVPGLSEL